MSKAFEISQLLRQAMKLTEQLPPERQPLKDYMTPKWLVWMMDPEEKKHYRDFEQEPKDEELTELAYELGWKKGDEFPDFCTYSMDGYGNLMWSGSGGGPNSGDLGEPFT